jgi:putative transcription factor
MPCEMCGKEEEHYFKISLEGSVLKVCSNCSKYGKRVQRNNSNYKNRNPNIKKEERDLVLVNNFHEIIEKARQKKGIKQEDFAKEINEKDSLLHQIETGHIKPTNQLARKLEKELGIILLEEVEEKYDINLKSDVKRQTNDVLTLGDLIKIKQKTRK